MCLALNACASRPPCGEKAAFEAGRESAAVAGTPAAEGYCPASQGAYRRGFAAGAAARCNAAQRWQQAAAGQPMAVDPWCDEHGGQTWRQSAALGTQYFQMHARWLALGGSEITTEVLERQRLEVELNSLTGIAALRGWSLPDATE